MPIRRSRERESLAALTPVLVGDANEGLFAPSTAFSRERVMGVFVAAVEGASDRPKGKDAQALGRVLYVLHLAVILWWLLDKGPGQRATSRLIALLETLLPIAAQTLRLSAARRFVQSADLMCREGLFGEEGAGAPE